MRAADHPAMIALLTRVMASYGKPLPESSVLKAWLDELAPFSPKTIEMAFSEYSLERPDFAPAPNGIAARCRLNDGRPDENEAWAQSLPALDEFASVTWTKEMGDAFLLARPMLEGGDEIGARMAFKDAYKRMVAEARAKNIPAEWMVSAGFDGERRHLEVARAMSAGLLPAPPAHLMLESGTGLPPVKPEGLKQVLEAIAPIVQAMSNPHERRDAEIESQTEAQRAESASIDARVKEYFRQHPEARFGNLPIPKDEDEPH